MMSPISLIPPELLSKIFLYTVTGHPVADSTNERFTLINVSSQWRVTALQTSELWSDIKICVPISDVDSGSLLSKKKLLAMEWLSRSGDSIPLSVELQFQCDSDPSKTIGPFFADIIRPYIARVKKLRLNGWTAAAALYEIEKTTSEKFTMLEEVLLFGQNTVHPGSMFGETYHPVFSTTPMLKRALLMNPLRWESLYTIPLPYNQLTHLLLGVPMHYHDWRNILKECSTTLEWGAFSTRGPDRSIYESVHLANLTNLYLLSIGPFMGPFLHGIHCPSLETFSLDAFEIRLDESSLDDFFRVIAPIRRLHIDTSGSSYSLHDFLELFSATPSLEVLMLNMPALPDYEDLFQALTPTDSHSILPRLTTLAIFDGRAWVPRMFLPDKFIALLESRWTDHPPLYEAENVICRLEDVKVRFDGIELCHSDSSKVLERLIQEGLDVTFDAAQVTFGWRDWLQSELDQMEWSRGVELVNHVDSELEY
ncbi:hypothetical protein BDQ17DRAFT_1372511 [Cyathus striatus]|nr:hypothetical protein BDQ17DRAFT_1372511 [Cyathus striatus]